MADTTDNSESSEISESSDRKDSLPETRRLGDFDLIRLLGAGGMAEVYLAQQISLKRLVAVKILKPKAVTSSNQTLLQRFEQEARAAGGLSHSNIVQVFLIGAEEDQHYIVQEYIQGENLAERIRKRGVPDFLTGVKWMKDVTAALKAAADAEIVHRDIKPENIMLTRDDVAKVTDFGLARLNNTEEKMNLTQDGTTMGTPWYMSPEQIQGETLDHRADQYAFGITCYHMFAGQPPFPGKNSVAVAVQHLKDEPTPLQQHRRDLPKQLCAIIHRMMEKKPEDRFNDPEQITTALNELQTASLNHDLIQTDSLGAWLKSSLPTPLRAFLMAVACFVFSLALSRFLFASPPLSEPVSGFPKEDTAAKQFAKAALQRSNTEGWKAVVDYYGKSDEAYYAQLQLGLHFLTVNPDPDRAEEWFQKLEERSAIQLDSRRTMMFCALIGQAFAAESKGDFKGRDQILSQRLASDFQPELQRIPPEVPETLADYVQQWQAESND